MNRRSSSSDNLKYNYEETVGKIKENEYHTDSNDSDVLETIGSKNTRFNRILDNDESNSMCDNSDVGIANIINNHTDVEEWKKILKKQIKMNFKIRLVFHLIKLHLYYIYH